MIEYVVLGIVFAVLAVIVAYSGSRAIALAWFRTKREYFHSVLRDINREKHNGEG